MCVCVMPTGRVSTCDVTAWRVACVLHLRVSPTATQTVAVRLIM